MRLTTKIGAVVTAGTLLTLTACGSSTHTGSPTTTGTSTTQSGSNTPSSTSAGDTIGITPTTITIGQLADESGPIPGIFQGAQNGLAAWAAYVNSTGGIGGRKIVIDFKDSALSCTTFQNGIKNLEQNTAAIVGSMSAVDVCGVPTITAAATHVLYSPAIAATNALKVTTPNVVTGWPEPPGLAPVGIVWIKNKYGAAAVQHTSTLYLSTSTKTQADEVAVAENNGYKYLYSRAFTPSETDFTSDILRMKANGTQIVDLTSAGVGPGADFVRQAAQQNFHPLAIMGILDYDASFLKLVGNPALATSLVAPLNYAMYLGQDANTVPEIATMTQWVQKVHPGAIMDLYTDMAWTAGLFFGQALEKAGPSPTRSSILAAAKSITSFNANGLLPTENPGDNVPSNCGVVVGVSNGQFVRLDPTTGYDCSLGQYFVAKS